MDSHDDDISFYLDNYKNQFVAHSLDDSPENINLFENAKHRLNTLFNELTIEKNSILNENTNTRKRINRMNRIIEETQEQNNRLETETTQLINSNQGAVEQNALNTSLLYQKHKIRMVAKLCLLATIIMFLYINDDIVRAIRSRFSTNSTSV